MTGAELRALREDAGVSLRDLAQIIGRDRGHLSRVERGEREATPALVTAYRSAAARPTVEDVRRREFLSAGAALPVLAMTDAQPQRIGAAEIAAVRAVALDVDMNHSLGVHAAQAALQRATEMLRARTTPANIGRLRSAVALLADRVGWGLFETGQDAAPTLRFAQRLAEMGDEPDLRAHALLDLAVSTPDSRVAVATLDHALAAPLGPAERVNLHAVAARRAAPVDRHVAGEHLARALDVEPEPVVSDWAARSTNAPGHLDAIVGFACYSLGHAAARERLLAAVGKLAPARRRTRARCHARLAGLALRDGAPDAAMVHLAHAKTHRSTLVAADLRAFAREAKRVDRDDLAALALRESA
jgi:transcriptional regulator with XRE-family HTH domain